MKIIYRKQSFGNALRIFADSWHFTGIGGQSSSGFEATVDVGTDYSSDSVQYQL